MNSATSGWSKIALFEKGFGILSLCLVSTYLLRSTFRNRCIRCEKWTRMNGNGTTRKGDTLFKYW